MSGTGGEAHAVAAARAAVRDRAAGPEHHAARLPQPAHAHRHAARPRGAWPQYFVGPLALLYAARGPHQHKAGRSQSQHTGMSGWQTLVALECLLL